MAIDCKHFADSARNDLYVTLTSCDFEKSGKTSQKNIEARVIVMHKEGEQVQVDGQFIIWRLKSDDFIITM